MTEESYNLLKCKLKVLLNSNENQNTNFCRTEKQEPTWHSINLEPTKGVIIFFQYGSVYYLVEALQHLAHCINLHGCLI